MRIAGLLLFLHPLPKNFGPVTQAEVWGTCEANPGCGVWARNDYTPRQARASAAVVCNDEGDCWRTLERLTYPPDARVQIYGDDYAIGPKYKWRDAREGNGVAFGLASSGRETCERPRSLRPGLFRPRQSDRAHADALSAV
jgi:hypothetical protein